MTAISQNKERYFVEKILHEEDIVKLDKKTYFLIAHDILIQQKIIY